MFLGRSESIKWIRRKFSKRNNNNSSANLEHTPAKILKSSNENFENIRDLNEILVINNTPTIITPTTVNVSKNLTTIHNNNEVPSTMPTNQTAPIAYEEVAEDETEETYEEKCQENMMLSVNVGKECHQKPQQLSVFNDISEQHGSGGDSAVSKSSRVRNYLRKCKDRWLAVSQHNQRQECNNIDHDKKPTISTTNKLDVNQDVKPTTTTEHSKSVISVIQSSLGDAYGSVNVDYAPKYTEEPEYGNYVDDYDEVVDASYEDIDFGLGAALARTAAAMKKTTMQTYSQNASTLLADSNNFSKSVQSKPDRDEKHLQLIAQQQKQDHVNDYNGNNVAQLVDSTQTESYIAALIDNYVACIYPIFNETTRAVLIREARDVLVNNYRGHFTIFEEQFFCKFIEIAVVLKERHQVGEALIWCQGWPLVTPLGEVILHLGGLDDDQVKPADIYLCVKTVEKSQEPQLYAVWRTPTEYPLIETVRTTKRKPTRKTSTTTAAITLKSSSVLKSCQLNYEDHTLYLSTLTLEMLNDDLPQLLQSLLIGVENSLERLSLNQLPQKPFNDGNVDNNDSAVTIPARTAATLTSSTTKGEKNRYGSGLNGSKLQLPNSPKCALRRSELITKNNFHNNKYVLRRLTNRQDSINSTSSGNSSASGLSTASSDSDSYAKNQFTTNNARNINNNVCNNNNFKTITAEKINTTATSAPQTETKNIELNSPALPRFCLGNTFPHIDSDEENPEEKLNSLTDDLPENEIILPNLITDLPEKLFFSGIDLPGTRDLKGNPLVTVDAESVVTAGLNCYEIATLLLYYSTVSECCLQSNNYLNGKTISDVNQMSQPISTAASSLALPTQLQSLNQATTSQYTTTIAANTQLSTKVTLTTSTKATCTSLNNNNDINYIHQQQQEKQKNLTFTILIAIENAKHLCVIDLISQSLKLLTRHITYCELLAICLDTNLLPTSNNNVSSDEKVAVSSSELKTTKMTKTTDTNGNHYSNKKSKIYTIKFISIDEVTTCVAQSQTPSGRLGGLHHHDARKWRDFLTQYEPFYNQCTGAAHRLVAALNDIRYADLQGLPTRRQLYAQHRALSRALMDSELHNLRKRSTVTMVRLQEMAKCINSKSHNANSSYSVNNKNGGSIKTTANINSSSSSLYSRSRTINSSGSSYSFNYQSNQNQSQISHNISTTTTTKSLSLLSSKPSAITATTLNPLTKSSTYSSNSQSSAATASRLSANDTNISSNYIHNNNNSYNNIPTTTIANIDVSIRLERVMLLFSEIDRATKRLEQLTEQRREHLRELTRQRALEDEINEVTSWITKEGSDSLQRFINLELDFDTPMKELEHEFEKYYFISMKHLAKGRDLHLAAACMEPLKESSLNLKKALDNFAEKLEIAREHIEGATRLYHLIHLHMLDDNLLHEMERLAEQYGKKEILKKYYEKENDRCKLKPESLNLHFNHNTMQKSIAQMVTSTPDTRNLRPISHRSSYGTGSFESPTCQCWRDSRNLDEMDEMLDNDEEERCSKIADSGVGECQRCEGNPKFNRVCSCQSLNEESENLYEKHDELDDECFEQPSNHYINVHSPWEANKHLQCFASTFELPKLEELSCLDPKIQKTLLLIMREMIGTERDYVRSLYYVIENYIDELLREDIPQSLRGQRNVIFGNIEKIFEFHNNNFLAELERYEHNPLKVGAAFLQMESKFYLYALYNKNKPKSDTLMSEYGTAFFKAKQIELNDKMDLASYLLKPVQRMGKYALLLQQLVKACNTVQGSALQEIAADVEELQKAEQMVKFQLRHGNDLLAMDSLKDCDVNVKEQGRLLRQNEFLVWQGRGSKKTLRQIFLFEELVLFSKARRFPDHKNLDIYIYKNSIKTSDIGLTAHVGDSPTKFEIWFRKRKPEDTFTLQCMSEDIKNAWTEEISKLLWQQAKRNREIRLAEMSSMGIGSKPCLDIRPSNNQINDRSITISQLGKAPKLRHSFVGLHTEQLKTSPRPISLISESSLSSGTSSSSLSKSSTSSSSSSVHHHNHLHNQHSHSQPLQHHPNQALELINECQTLALEGSSESCHRPQQLMTNAMSSSFSSQSGGGGGTINSRYRNHHKRSTTIVSQLSMESGIISDICMTPEQDNNDVLKTWPSHSTDAIISPTTENQKYLHKNHSSNTLGKKGEPRKTHNQQLQPQQYKQLKPEELVDQ